MGGVVVDHDILEDLQYFSYSKVQYMYTRMFAVGAVDAIFNKLYAHINLRDRFLKKINLF